MTRLSRTRRTETKHAMTFSCCFLALFCACKRGTWPLTVCIPHVKSLIFNVSLVFATARLVFYRKCSCKILSPPELLLGVVCSSASMKYMFFCCVLWSLTHDGCYEYCTYELMLDVWTVYLCCFLGFFLLIKTLSQCSLKTVLLFAQPFC